MMPFEEGSVNFSALLVCLVSVLGAMLIVFLQFNRSKENKGNLFLSLVLLQYVLYVFPDFLFVIGLLDDFPHAVRIYVVGSLLLGPMTYFYVRACTEEDFEIKGMMWLHFVPAVLDFLYQLPFYLLDGADKLPYFYDFFLEGQFQQPPLLTLFKIGQQLSYTILSIWLVFKYRNHLNNRTSYIDMTFHRWLLLFCVALTIPTLAGFVFTFTDANSSFLFLMIGIFLMIIVAFSLLVVKPSIFQRFPHQITEEDAVETKKEKYESSKLQATQKEKYLQKLLTFVESEKPYESTDLTLAELSNQIGIPPHYLSQIINEKLNVNFLDFINGYRVKAAKEKLVDPKLTHYTILSIAYESGFNAKSTFYAAFKKHTGMTPSQYRKGATLVS